MTSFGFCYLDLPILAERGGLREEIEEDRRSHWAWEAERARPEEITPCRLIPQGRREQRRRRRCGRPLSFPECRGGTGPCRVERRPPPAAARGPAELSPPSSTCRASAGSSSPRWPRGAGAVPRPLTSGSYRLLPATGDRDSACGCELELPEDAPGDAVGTALAAGRGPVSPSEESQGLAAAGLPAGGAPGAHEGLRRPHRVRVKGRPQGPAVGRALCRAAVAPHKGSAGRRAES
ncbi:uncharacterized protein LOC116573441 [Mustela erminea]|uniref:uncharacterized protein LOC116573441 n=1 Tax=Mustela erminea TaxID=36723 RepID=UPI0013874984|nr:uncharacterized protein LOC116573441 [Mustela erminea]